VSEEEVPTRVLRRSLEEALEVHTASTVLFEALGAAGSRVPQTRDDVLELVRGPLREILARRLDPARAEDIVAQVVDRIRPDPSTVEMPLDDLAAETRREDSTSSFTTAHEVVSVMVVAASLGFAQRINVAFGTGRVAPWVVSTERELEDALEGQAPPIVIVDASDIPAIPQRVLMRRLAALPSTTACVVWGRELPYGRVLAEATEASGRAWITLEKKEGIAPLLDLVRSRRKNR